MRGFNIYRPLILIAVAFVAKNLVTTICVVAGMSKEPAVNLGYLAMIAAGLIAYKRLNRGRKRR